MRHTSIQLNIVATILALSAILLSIFMPDVLSRAELWILGFSIVMVGIPHGALDHLIAANVYEQGNSLKDHLLFYGWYLILMVLIAALWFIYPTAGLLLFLVISILHFGQADIEGFYHADQKSESKALLLNSASVSRGLLIIGLILTAYPDQVIPILSAALGEEAWFLSWLNTSYASLKQWVLIQFVFIALLVLWKGDLSLSMKFRYAVDSLLIVALFNLVAPLLAFAVYFALWHSVGHIGEITHYFKEINEPLTLTGFYLKALPFSLVSFVGLGILLWVTQSFSLENQIISLTFVLISVLTLPHMVVAHRLIRSNTKVESA